MHGDGLPFKAQATDVADLARLPSKLNVVVIRTAETGSQIAAQAPYGGSRCAAYSAPRWGRKLSGLSRLARKGGESPTMCRARAHTHTTHTLTRQTRRSALKRKKARDRLLCLTLWRSGTITEQLSSCVCARPLVCAVVSRVCVAYFHVVPTDAVVGSLEFLNTSRAEDGEARSDAEDRLSCPRLKPVFLFAVLTRGRSLSSVAIRRRELAARSCLQQRWQRRSPSRR